MQENFVLQARNGVVVEKKGGERREWWVKRKVECKVWVMPLRMRESKSSGPREGFGGLVRRAWARHNQSRRSSFSDTARLPVAMRSPFSDAQGADLPNCLSRSPYQYCVAYPTLPRVPSEPPKTIPNLHLLHCSSSLQVFASFTCRSLRVLHTRGRHGSDTSMTAVRYTIHTPYHFPHAPNRRNALGW